MTKSKNPIPLARIFLESLSSDDGQCMIESLKTLCDILENKIDPDPIEIRLVEDLYNVLENLNIMEYNMRSYINNKNIDVASSNKLAKLLEKDRRYGTSLMFDV